MRNVFRTFDKLEDAMMRLAMPKTSASDPPSRTAPSRYDKIVSIDGSRLAAPLRVTLAELAHA